MTQDPNEHEELVHADDAVIGRALKRSLLAILLAAGVLSAAYLVFRPRHRQLVESTTALTIPTQVKAPSAELPYVPFTDVTASSGIHFRHVNGANGNKLLPESMGGGVAFFDFDGDGRQDLLFVSSCAWPGQEAPGPKPSSLVLYHNDGDGHFTDVTAGSGLDITFYGMGVAVGDYDNDGLPDIFVTGVNGNHLFHNEGHGKFREVTAEAGVGGSGSEWSTSATWLDYDNDGKLDLFVCNYVRWSREIDLQVGFKLVGLGRAYGQPKNFQGSFCYLYHNEGNGRFRDVSASAGIQVKNPDTGVPTGKALGVVPVDIDGDGWMDLVVANDGVQNFVFHNKGDGSFQEIGAICGVGFDNYGMARGGMGIDAARYRNDGSLGIVIGNFATEMTALYVSQDKPLEFADETITEGVGPPGWRFLKFGVFFFDCDLDGRLDILTADGHLEQEIGKIQQDEQYRQPAQLFWNSGIRSGKCFIAMPPSKTGVDLGTPVVGRGSAFADIDGDGDLDVIITQIDGPPLLLRNDQALHHHFLRLKLVGTRSNRDAIGALVTVRNAGQTLVRQVTPTHSYLSQSELPVTVGLGDSAMPESVEIRWPSGTRQNLKEITVDRTMTIVEPTQ